MQATLVKRAPAALPPNLAGLLHCLPNCITTFSMYPRPLLLPSLPPPEAGSPKAEPQQRFELVMLGAAATASGHVELFTVSQGQVTPLSLEVAASLAAHK